VKGLLKKKVGHFKGEKRRGTQLIYVRKVVKIFRGGTRQRLPLKMGSIPPSFSIPPSGKRTPRELFLSDEKGKGKNLRRKRGLCPRGRKESMRKRKRILLSKNRLKIGSRLPEGRGTGTL